MIFTFVFAANDPLESFCELDKDIDPIESKKKSILS